MDLSLGLQIPSKKVFDLLKTAHLRTFLEGIWSSRVGLCWPFRWVFRLASVGFVIGFGWCVGWVLNKMPVGLLPRHPPHSSARSGASGATGGRSKLQAAGFFMRVADSLCFAVVLMQYFCGLTMFFWRGVCDMIVLELAYIDVDDC